MLDKSKVSLGIAPIGWTNDDMPDLGKENTFEQTVSEMALAGFTGSEVGSHYPADPAVLKKALDLRGMTICNQWFSSFLITVISKGSTYMSSASGVQPARRAKSASSFS